MEAHYHQTRHEYTPRGEGLAMVARQSCIAGPSVFSGNIQRFYKRQCTEIFYSK
jgi:hypothetical protein